MIIHDDNDQRWIGNDADVDDDDCWCGSLYIYSLIL